MAEYRKGKAEFVNPYNFIPIGDSISKTDISDMKDEDLVSGELVCRVTVKTPLAIPGDVEKREEQKNQKDHNVYKVFRYMDSGNVVIPGSTIRGMIRSEYETITNSCFRTTNGDEYLTSRANVSNGARSNAFKPALLIKENNQWKLYEAERIPLVMNGIGYKNIYDNDRDSYVRFEYGYDEERKEFYVKDQNNERLYYGDKVIFNGGGPGHEKITKKRTFTAWKNSVDKLYKADENADGKLGYLYIGEPISSKHAESVFKKGDELKKVKEKEILKAIHSLETVIRMYRDKAINRNLYDLAKDKNQDEKNNRKRFKNEHYGYPGYERAKRNNIIPVWYDDVSYANKKLVLSMASIGRFSYLKNMSEITKEHTGCTSRKELCPACALFGMTGKNEESKGSNLRFTDAFLCKDEGTTKNVLLKELGAPRPSYLQFYSEGGKSYNQKDAVIRGRKYYWHIPKAAENAEIYTDKTATNRNSTMELINTGNEFQFSVYYDSITEDQLRVLKYVLSLEDDKHMHKLGHGKPLGLGSVKIQILDDRRKVNDLNMDNYCINKERIDNNSIDDIKFVDAEALKQFNIITNFDEVRNMEVRYPFVSIIEKYSSEKDELKENVLASHQWFSHNEEELPDIMAPNMYRTFNQYEVYEITDKDKVKKKNDNKNGYWDNNRGNNNASRVKNKNGHRY